MLETLHVEGAAIWAQPSIVVSLLFVLTYLAAKLYSIHASQKPYRGFPLVALEGKDAKTSWTKAGNEVVEKGLAEHGDSPFQVMTGTGPKLILKNKYADEIGKNKDMSMMESVRMDFFAHYPGFEGVKAGMEGTLLRDTVVRKLTQSLGIVTEDLVEEATDSIHDIFGEDPEWKTTKIKADVLQMVSRLSSRVFLGKPLCRNQRWLDIAKDYTIHSFGAARELRQVSPLIRRIKHWFMPTCVDLRKDFADAQKLIAAECQQREAAAKKLLAVGKKPPKKSDAIAWFVEMSQELGIEADLVSLQLSLSLAAIHTTTEATVQALEHLCEHPEYVQSLREEIIRVIGEHGWHKTTLYQLKLMDSFLNESQRLSRGSVGMIRIALKDAVLQDGMRIPKGTRFMVASRYFDPAIFPDPYKFDGFRFSRLRETTGQTNNWQYVSTSPEHLGFGFGVHACPGRFFVANEIKIALAQLILKYDWSFDPVVGKTPPLESESAIMVHPDGQLRHKRRREEIDLTLVQ